MIPATQEQIEAACMTRSAENAAAHLRTSGLTVTRAQCEEALTRLLNSGKRGRIAGGGYTEVIADTDAGAARIACQALLRRHLATGKHWISDPARMASALREAGMVRA